MKFSALIISALLLFACNKSNQNASLKVRMTDAPGDFQEVNVEVKEFRVHYSEEGWVNLATNAGVYDLLRLQDSISVVLVEDGEIPPGKITQVRLVLGESNNVKVDDAYYYLEIPSGETSGLKINLKTTLEADESYDILLDFDANQSVSGDTTDGFKLKPVIKVESVTKL